MSLPHPIDNEWRTFDQYFKAWYDVEDPTTGEVVPFCWPNAGVLTPAWNPGSNARDYHRGECRARISFTCPWSGNVQLNQETVADLLKFYS